MVSDNFKQRLALRQAHLEQTMPVDIFFQPTNPVSAHYIAEGKTSRAIYYLHYFAPSRQVKVKDLEAFRERATRYGLTCKVDWSVALEEKVS